MQSKNICPSASHLASKLTQSARDQAWQGNVYLVLREKWDRVQAARVAWFGVDILALASK